MGLVRGRMFACACCMGRFTMLLMLGRGRCRAVEKDPRLQCNSMASWPEAIECIRRRVLDRHCLYRSWINPDAMTTRRSLFPITSSANDCFEPLNTATQWLSRDRHFAIRRVWSPNSSHSNRTVALISDDQECRAAEAPTLLGCGATELPFGASIIALSILLSDTARMFDKKRNGQTIEASCEMIRPPLDPPDKERAAGVFCLRIGLSSGTDVRDVARRITSGSPLPCRHRCELRACLTGMPRQTLRSHARPGRHRPLSTSLKPQPSGRRGQCNR